MTNLLEETKQVMGNHGKTVNDISWIGSVDGEYAIAWEEFEKIANVEYDSGFGAQEIASDLVVVFKDATWLSRGEYDGSEWWDYNDIPKKKDIAKPFTNLGGHGIMWDTLEELNKTNSTVKS